MSPDVLTSVGRPYGSGERLLLPRPANSSGWWTACLAHACHVRTSPSKAVPHPPSYLSLTKPGFSLPEIIPEPGTRQGGMAPMPQSHQNHSRHPILNCLLCPALPFPWKPQQRLWPPLSSASCRLPPDHPGTSPGALCSTARLLLSGNVIISAALAPPHHHSVFPL